MFVLFFSYFGGRTEASLIKQIFDHQNLIKQKKRNNLFFTFWKSLVLSNKVIYGPGVFLVGRLLLLIQPLPAVHIFRVSIYFHRWETSVILDVSHLCYIMRLFYVILCIYYVIISMLYYASFLIVHRLPLHYFIFLHVQYEHLLSHYWFC